ncbi:adhesion G protein-coupled receptor G3 [Gracilinanus agilis]|uniref:adhesion G protein-coupled receptor G3 n=1 Tax=Gracilinanus agilis TaxID=191870 RepID=UPI001CFCCD86|nr:adhesion G protein-coupled receptor G3 [Gracilinanus agilis]
MRLRAVMRKSLNRCTPSDLGAMLLLGFLLLLQLDPMRAKTEPQTNEKPNIRCSEENPPLSTHGAANCFVLCNQSSLECNSKVIESFWIKKEEELAENETSQLSLYEPKVKATVHIVSASVSQDVSFSFSPSQMTVLPAGNETEAPDRVRLPRSLFERLRPKMSSVRVVLMVINIGKGDIFKGQQLSSTVLDKRIVGIRVGKEPIRDLEELVEITFSHKPELQKLQCVFWDDNKGGDWKSTGCYTEQKFNQTICRCDHLSFFALLLKPIDASTAKTLNQISLAGCSTSLCFLILTIILYFALRFTRQKFKSEDAPKIHVALSISLALLNLTFIINQSSKQGTSCPAQGGIFHFFLLCCFTWMGIEAFHLYLLAIKIFNIYIRHYFLKLCLVGWGFPILVVLITGSTGSYGQYTIDEKANGTHEKLCWIKNRTALYITVHAYFVVIFLFGAVVLSLVAWKIFHLRGSRAGKEQNQTWKGILTVLGLSCLVGGTWGLFLLTQIGLTTVYIFTLLNSLQGKKILSI